MLKREGGNDRDTEWEEGMRKTQNNLEKGMMEAPRDKVEVAATDRVVRRDSVAAL